MKNPKIYISYNRFLDPIFVGWIQAQPQWKNWQAPPIEEVKKNIESYKREWRKCEKVILEGMRKATNLNFFRNQIDVHVVSGNPRSFSRPIIIKGRYTPSEFLFTLTHELIHCLFADNNGKVKDPYPENPHIVVHAILKHIYLDVLHKPKELEGRIKGSDDEKNMEYKKAWQVVEKIGYKTIIEKIRSWSSD